MKIDKKLPQIIIPRDKLIMFMDWWDNDIRYETTVPRAFNEGYMLYQLPKSDFSGDMARNAIKVIAKALGHTYREVENRLKELNDNEMTIYFKFVGENKMYFERYEGEDLVAKGTGELGGNPDKPDPKMSDLLGEVGAEAISFHRAIAADANANVVNVFSIYLVVTALWYIATATSNKYIYERETPVVTSKHKHKKVIQVKPERTIKTPIYDMRKIRIVKTDSLIARRKGWTYSHAFQVHGHYRHYKTGKVVFIEPYIKGKGKELQQQSITLSPSDSDKEKSLTPDRVPSSR